MQTADIWHVIGGTDRCFTLCKSQAAFDGQTANIRTDSRNRAARDGVLAARR